MVSQFYRKNTVVEESWTPSKVTKSEALYTMVEAYALLCEDSDSDDEEEAVKEAVCFLNEGGNTDSWKSYRTAKKAFKEASKRAKKCVKAGDKEGAKKAIEDGKKALDDFEACLKAVDPSVGSAVFGYFADGLLQMAYMVIPMAGMTAGSAVMAGGAAKAITTGGAAGGIAAVAGGLFTSASSIASWVAGIVALIKDIQGLCDAFDERKDEKLAGKLNLFRNKMFLYLKEMRKSLDKLENNIK
jgi:hypothetical protein